MFCTGGIRCEKASAYMLKQGFEEVYHLKGGILKYLETVPAEQSLWQGECFVFDTRVAVDRDQAEGGYVQCHACRRPLSKAELDSADYREGVSCPKCINEADEDRDSERATLVADGSSFEAVAIIDQDGHGFVKAGELPALGADQTYQLWGVVDTGAEDPDVISLGIFGPNPELETFTTESEVVALAITIEQAPGVISDGNPDGIYVGTVG